jgi:hypothetical protein
MVNSWSRISPQGLSGYADGDLYHQKPDCNRIDLGGIGVTGILTPA